jgi:quinolinate synthase
LQDPPKFTQISIFVLEICHLATQGTSRKKQYFVIESKTARKAKKEVAEIKKERNFVLLRHNY